MSWTVWISSNIAGQLLAPLWLQTQRKGSQQRSQPPESFWAFFSTCFEIWTWNLVCTLRWHDTSNMSFITIRSLPLESFRDFFQNVFRYQHIEFTFHLSGVPVTYFMFLAYAQLTNNAFTDAGKQAYYAASDCSCWLWNGGMPLRRKWNCWNKTHN